MMPPARTSGDKTRAAKALALLAEGGVALVAVLIFLWALRANLDWFERHLLQSYIVPRGRYEQKVFTLRVCAALLSISLVLFVRPRIGRWMGKQRPGALLAAAGRIAFVVLLATGLFEVVLGQTARRMELKRQQTPPLELKFGSPHSRYGWLWKASQKNRILQGGREIEYVFNARHNRVRNLDQTEDVARPTVLFVGESTAAGYGVTYDESYAAQVGAKLGLQSVNLAVGGYACDQAFLRFIDELPHYAQPQAVVTLFLPALLDRTMRDFRPHLVLAADLDAELGPLSLRGPATDFFSRLRLRTFLRNVIPYHSDAQNEAALNLVGTIFSETARLARARGAVPLFVIPSLGQTRNLDEHFEAWIIRDLFAARGLPYLFVDLDPTWTVPRDGHPDARAHKVLADAIAERVLRDIKAHVPTFRSQDHH